MARVHTSRFAARKGATLTCGRCQRPIEKGEAYRWFAPGFRSQKRIRCTRPECSPRPSELDASIFSEVLVAQEAADVAFNDVDTRPPDMDPATVRGELDAIVQDVKDAVESVAQQYDDSAQAMGEYGAGQQMADWRDNLQQADVMEWQSEDGDDPSPCDEHEEADPECDECQAAFTEWAEQLIDSAREVVSDIARD